MEMERFDLLRLPDVHSYAEVVVAAFQYVEPLLLFIVSQHRLSG